MIGNFSLNRVISEPSKEKPQFQYEYFHTKPNRISNFPIKTTPHFISTITKRRPPNLTRNRPRMTMHPENAQKADTEKTRLSGPVSKSRSITRKIQRLSRQRLSRRATIIPQSSPADQHIKMFFRFASIEHKKINLAPGGGRPSVRRGMCARRVCVTGSGC